VQYLLVCSSNRIFSSGIGINQSQASTNCFVDNSVRIVPNKMIFANLSLLPPRNSQNQQQLCFRRHELENLGERSHPATHNEKTCYARSPKNLNRQLRAIFSFHQHGKFNPWIEINQSQFYTNCFVDNSVRIVRNKTIFANLSLLSPRYSQNHQQLCFHRHQLENLTERFHAATRNEKIRFTRVSLKI